MIINHNIPALNTYRQMGINQGNMQNSMEKLSSGLRINKAGDDAAGLAISEKMRAQIKGLDQASRNASDGISLIQTAEGALNETHSILQRIRELATQSSNGTNTDEDREAIQDEVNQLTEEIDRIGNTTEFNTQKLLNGNLESVGSVTSGDNVTISGKVFKETAGELAGVAFTDASALDFTGAVADEVIVDGAAIDVDWTTLSDDDKALLDQDLSGATADQVKEVRDIVEGHINKSIDAYNESTGANIEHISANYDGANKTLTLNSGIEGNGSSVELTTGGSGVLSYYVGDGATATDGKNQVMEAVPAETLKFEINGVDFETAALTSANSGADAADVATDLQGLIKTKVDAYNTNAGLSKGDEGFIGEVTVEAKEGRLFVSSPSGDISFTEQDGGTAVGVLGLDKASTTSAGNGPMSFQIGANSGQKISFGINDMRSTALGVSNLDVSNSAGAENALDALDEAISSVSSERSKLGAFQNRLEHTISNLDNSSENLTAAESRIRDVDMAKEMMEMTKSNILSQASQSMLAQANQQPQAVLQLLG
ncbi:flagellin [Gracilibacillus ureilyticus]|uniref:Flagellin n=1 Tax=Gracilibacillus ureilyticus TaxID=531814 RepID=A0A1H9NY54_9BACI|nr:flagellin [Gracilibacillus ureilyticus]SER40727.1 flagellin [Gracilibacillus ureilyticus]